MPSDCKSLCSPSALVACASLCTMLPASTWKTWNALQVLHSSSPRPCSCAVEPRPNPIWVKSGIHLQRTGLALIEAAVKRALEYSPTVQGHVFR